LKYLPPKAKHHANKKTLVLDLDETLVHSGFKQFHRRSDMLLKIVFDNKMHDVHVLIRPGVDEFLEKMSRHYELVIFTASLSTVIFIYLFLVCKSINGPT
jgi:RNA polymerase II subunit A small phosphatase-like protein